ncbi:hypothetical protein DYB32_010072 [Aphanomyces invadans]|nr:hypothetical protein DYB32_010072 [Aphanomyces invadans]
MKDRMPLLPDLPTTLSMPLWLTTYHEFVQPSNKTVSSLASGSTPARLWCQLGVSNGLRCLRDFMHANVPGYWPDFRAFHNIMSSGYRGATVSLQHGQICFDTVPYTKSVYDHLTQVYDAVRTRLSIRRDVSLTSVPTAAHPFRAVIKNQLLLFERWPRGIVAAMAQHSPIPTAPHPTHTPERPGHDAAKTYTRLLKRCLRWTTPVHCDVWFRATLIMLPVNSRYKHRPDVDRAVLQCSHGCSADETIEPALHACPKASALWTLHQTAWSCFGIGFSWLCITNIDGFTTNGRGAPHMSALF